MRTLLLLFALLLPAGLAAHEVRPAIATATITQDGSFEVLISLNLEAVMAGIEPDHSDTGDSPQAPAYNRLRGLTPEQLQDEFSGFARQFLAGISLAPSGQPATALEAKRLVIPPVGDLDLPRISEIALAGTLPGETVSVVWRFDPTFGDSVIRLKMAGADDLFLSQYVSGAVSEPLPLDPSFRQSWTSVFTDYLRLGFVHIVPKGLDHILFVVSLFLLSTRLRTLLWQVTAFTVAHTVTLALGVTGAVAVSPSIVEPLIALSIVYIAVENLFTKRLHPWRPVIVFGFGLLHGLGFAGVLEEVGLSEDQFVTGLIAFNVGVELGQLAVIAVCFLLVGWLMQSRSYRKFVVVPGSAAIAIVGAFWFVERLAT